MKSIIIEGMMYAREWGWPKRSLPRLVESTESDGTARKREAILWR